MNILEQLWREGFNPMDSTVRGNEEYSQIRKKAIEEEHKILNELSESGQRAYERATAHLDAMALIRESHTFAVGFRLGARVMLNVLGEMGENE